MKKQQSRSYLRLVTEADRALYEGPITRMGLWYRYPAVNYKKKVRVVVSQWVLLRALIYWGFQV
ncbi:MAG: hypothetical protein FJ112_00195 [Deltaproteobacteria bacterium]|nr:hypothetical protein [Deltaproteobacteria bacterium]